MYVPSSTYRIQFSPSFGFRAAEQVAGYLRELGISTVYASPVFKARKNSAHGYDVVDPNQLNPELGSQDEFSSLIATLKAKGMGWLQDFVPNHMAYDTGNQMLMDIFEKGPSSPFFDFFDVVWDHLRENLRGKLIAPFLGGPYGEALEKGELALEYENHGFLVRYYDTKYPIRIESYGDILAHRLDSLQEKLGEEHHDFIKTLGLIESFRHLHCDRRDEGSKIPQIRLARELLRDLEEANDVIKRFILENVSSFNQNVDMLDRLLLKQWFRLTYWRVATKEINYQRFFNINELISLRVEDEAVFRHIHRLALKWIADGTIDGLRIDHVDGLYDPTRYLIRVRAEAEGAYIAAEKILELDEDLTSRWPVQGTTGYDFLNYVNGLFVNASNKQSLQDVYSGFTGLTDSYDELVYEKKKLFIDRHLTGDLDNLTYVLKKISITTRKGIDLTWIGLKTALIELAAVFPVYRTYIDGIEIEDRDRLYLDQAMRDARKRSPDLNRELDFIESVLTLDCPDHIGPEDRRLWLSFVMRFQQFTSPLMAKGLEDTTFYVFNRLLSLNEVGGNPDRFGIGPDEFHAWIGRRAIRFPHTLNATATHDTKRGEDVRARINVLSELPDEWGRNLAFWSELNSRFKRTLNGNDEAPDRNLEYFLYQTLIGALPFDEKIDGEFVDRIKSYIIKAAREAKLRTFWLDPNQEYEGALLEFTESILVANDAAEFRRSFLGFQREIAFYGVVNSLSQLLIKIASPGVPDFYQGTELWDFNLVDPDNRRLVDYEKRNSMLLEVEEGSGGHDRLLEEILAGYHDGRVKLFTTCRALATRNGLRDVFEAGEYMPLEIEGEHATHAIAFARRAGDRWALVASPRLVTGIVKPGAMPLGEKVWRGTYIRLPGGAPPRWRNRFTGAEVSVDGQLRLADVLRDFPMGLLTTI